MKKLLNAPALIVFTLCAPFFVAVLPERSPTIPHAAFQTNRAGQLLLKTSFNAKRDDVFASASTAGGAASGFGPGIFITCNSIPIIDTRNGNSHRNAGSFVTIMDSLYDWNYEGPDTTFEVVLPATPPPVIADSFAGKTIYLADSLTLPYAPTGSCSYMQFILGDEFQDSIRPYTICDTATGQIYPTWIGSLGLQSGAGTIAIARIKYVAFSSPSFYSILVEDSAVSKPVDVVWQ